MIIKVIPETAAEKARMKEVEHTGVKEFFMFGNKLDADNDLVDFHDWTGGYKMLIGNLAYFQNFIINEERNSMEKSRTAEIKIPKKMIKQGAIDANAIEFPKDESKKEGKTLQEVFDKEVRDIKDVKDVKEIKPTGEEIPLGQELKYKFGDFQIGVENADKTESISDVLDYEYGIAREQPKPEEPSPF